jgi:hypothetical protein
MKIENRFFDVFPKVVQTDKFTTITIKDRYKQSFIKDGTEYEIRYYPLERFSHISEYKYQEVKLIKAVEGTLQIEQYFKDEQEHILEVQEKGNDNQTKKMSFRIYSLEEDLFSRKPYKGDMHMHTYHSDGKESPAYVTASCRKIGLDFMAVTDHGRYFPSKLSQEAFKDADIDLLICRGEEVHPVNNPVHMINFGGSFSINEMINEHKEKYMEEVKKIEDTIMEIEDEDSRYQCASCIWCFDKIREAGGMSIFCHPYWLVREGYYISDTVTSYLHDTQPFDSLEVIGGYYKHEEESNTLQVARYHEERSKGRKIPIVGVSDAHGCENGNLFGWYYTIVFSPALEQKELIGSIKDLYSVAVEAIPGEAIRAYGPFRLVKYAQFLMREVMPDHDELCFEEGRLMLGYLAGETGAEERLKVLKGSTKALLEKLWAK